MQKIKKGDLVQVISGNEVGLRGEVDRVLKGRLIDRHNKHIGRDANKDKLLVKGVNVRKKHQRPISQTRTQTGIIDKELPVHISNVMLVCPSCDEAVRVGFRVEGDKKVRFCKRCNATVDKV
ncbi:MAG: 50S ribosomal protein L24 [Anaerolineae bacterium]|nr:50S ribosomal protein L24 [Anaerolineae bacterium]